MTGADENKALIARFYTAFAARDGTSMADRFSFGQWSRQAFGLLGLLTGWTPFLRSAVRRKAKGDLATFMRSDAGTQPA